MDILYTILSIITIYGIGLLEVDNHQTIKSKSDSIVYDESLVKCKPVYVGTNNIALSDSTMLSHSNFNILKYLIDNVDLTDINLDREEIPQTWIIIEFIITKDGKLTDVKLVSPTKEHIHKIHRRYVEAISEMQGWIPGTIDNIPVNTRLICRFNIDLQF